VSIAFVLRLSLREGYHFTGGYTVIFRETPIRNMIEICGRNGQEIMVHGLPVLTTGSKSIPEVVLVSGTLTRPNRMIVHEQQHRSVIRWM
jgi:hypothetical protein